MGCPVRNSLAHCGLGHSAVEDAYCIMRRNIGRPLLLSIPDGGHAELDLWYGQGHGHGWIIMRITNIKMRDLFCISGLHLCIFSKMCQRFGLDGKTAW